MESDAKRVAFEERLTETQADLLAFVISMLPFCRDEARDVAQAANLQMIRHAAEYDFARPFRPWAFQFAKGAVLNFLRTKGRERAKIVFDEETIERSVAWFAGDDAREPLWRRLAVCKEKLAAGQKMLLDLRYGQELSPREIAKLLNRRVEQVYQELSYLRRKLAACMKRACELSEDAVLLAERSAFRKECSKMLDGGAENWTALAPLARENLEEWLEQSAVHSLLQTRRREHRRKWNTPVSLAAALAALLAGGAFAKWMLATPPEKTSAIATEEEETDMKTTLHALAATAALAAIAPAGSLADGTDHLHFRMDEKSGNLVSVDGSYSIAPSGIVQGGIGALGRGVSFGGKSRGTIQNTKTLIPATGDFGVFMWINYTSASTTQMHLFANSNGQEGRWHLYVNPGAANVGKFGFWGKNGNIGVGALAPAKLNDGKWHLVGVTRTDGVFTVWEDGVACATDSSANTKNFGVAQTENWAVGNNVVGNAPYTGRMDELHIFNRKVTDEDVEQLYALIPDVPESGYYSWKFDETQAEDFAMDGGEMPAVSLGGIASDANGPYGKCVDHDGSGGIVIPGSQKLMDLPEWSAFVWVRVPEYLATERDIFSCYQASSAGRWNLQYLGDDIRIFNPQGVVVATGAATLCEWIRVGIVRKAETMEIWENGSLAASKEYTDADAATFQSGMPIAVGCRSENATECRLAASFDELRFYPKALTEEEVASAFAELSAPGEDGLVAHWSFDNANDEQANIRPDVGLLNAQAMNDAATGPVGVSGKGVYYGGKSAYVRLVNSQKLIPATGPFTVSLWMRCNHTANRYQTALFNNNAGQAGRSAIVYDDSNTKKVNFFANNANGLNSIGSCGPVLNDGVWHMISFTRSGGNIVLYVDGTAVGVKRDLAETAAFTQEQEWYVGNRKDMASGFGEETTYGVIDDVRVYNRALPATELTALYNAFAPLPTVAPVKPLYRDIPESLGASVVHHCGDNNTNSSIHLPNICVLPNGDYLATATIQKPTQRLFAWRSSDKGATWTKAAQMDAGGYAGAPFVDGENIYCLGGAADGSWIAIWKSSDNGATWKRHQLTTSTGYYFRAGLPAIHNGRICFAMERRDGSITATAKIRFTTYSAQCGADLTDPAAWTFSDYLDIPAETLGGKWQFARDARIVSNGNKLSFMTFLYETLGYPGNTLLLEADGYSDAPAVVSTESIVSFPGGNGSFATPVWDSTSHLWWGSTFIAGKVHLFTSTNLRNWTWRGTVFSVDTSAGQVVACPSIAIDGDNLAVLAYASYPDGDSSTVSAGKQNFLWFRKVENFRNLAVDKTEARLLIADRGANVVRRINRGTSHTWLFDDGKETVFASCEQPSALAQIGQTVYVAEGVAGGRILAYSRRGSLQGVVAAMPSSSTADALASNGTELYILDKTANALWRLVAGELVKFRDCTAPAGIAGSPTGTLWLLDDGTLYSFSSSGENSTALAATALVWDSGANRPLALSGTNVRTVDSAATVLAGVSSLDGAATFEGALYVANSLQGRVTVQTSGVLHGIIDPRGTPSAMLVIPEGGAVFPDISLGTVVILQ